MPCNPLLEPLVPPPLPLRFVKGGGERPRAALVVLLLPPPDLLASFSAEGRRSLHPRCLGQMLHAPEVALILCFDDSESLSLFAAYRYEQTMAATTNMDWLNSHEAAE
jgi:hypothetical protein